MRTSSAIILAVGLGGFLAVGCGSSTTTDGGTTGTTTGGVTGSTTGATSGGTSTGGTTTGGTAGLAPGAACTANGQCLSDICGVAGSGHCCSALCSTGDSTCGASDCDATGACTYPTGTACGSSSCNAGVLTTSACDTNGTCAAGTPAPCAGHLNCADATSCLATCTSSTDCVNGFYCNGDTCEATLPAGAVCTSNGACQSSLCGTTGSGNCCTAACDTSDTTCGATGCDDTGACTYPPNTTACGAGSCTGSTLTGGACDGTSGACVVGTAPCPNHFACADATSCKTICSGGSDCASGNYCSAGACLPLLPEGTPCSVNAACGSGVCGIDGTGNCCSTACTVGDAICGATGCDTNGACLYAPADTACGRTTCTGSTLTASACTGDGTCLSNGGVPCPNGFACTADGTACNSSCSASTQKTDCAASSFCDTVGGVCCAALDNGATINVDNGSGDDTGCCGYGTASPCQTLTRAMQLVNETNSRYSNTPVILTATINAGSNSDWAVETYPVLLDWGVTVSAGGIYFTDTNGATELFDVTLGSGETPGNVVTLDGDLSFFSSPAVVIGIDSQGNVMSDAVGIQIEDNAKLEVANMVVYEPTGSVGIVIGTDVSPGTASLGIAGGGTLKTGGKLPNGTALASNLGTGILCHGAMTDRNYTGFFSYSFRGRNQDISIDAEDGCALDMRTGPEFGYPPAGGYTGQGDGCTGNAAPMDAVGLQVNGNATVTMTNPYITCMSKYGISSTNTANEATSPTVTVSGVSLDNCGAAGLYVTAGTVTVLSGIIQYNFIGVDMENDGTNTPSVVLNDGTGAFQTTVTCNSNQEPVPPASTPGIDVYNNSTGTLQADWVNWDYWFQPNADANALYWPDYYWCDDSFSCTCESVDSSATSQCMNTNGVGGDGMNLVYGIGSGSAPSTTPDLGAQAQSDGFGTGACQ